jgi:catechol 2,3-dioxygenase-like lactoylglutathione lyase family enzyme
MIIDAISHPPKEHSMSRLQLALDVADLDAAIDFYSKLFATEPAKRKPGYANFAIADPPLKLVLFQTTEGQPGGTINHLGVETETAAEVVAAEARLVGDGVETTGVDDTTCCYATKVETWVTDPDGSRWEWYVKTGDADQLTDEILGEHEGPVCCAPAAPAPAASSCC